MNFRERYTALREEWDVHGELMYRIDCQINPPEWEEEVVEMDGVTQQLLEDLYEWHTKEYVRIGAEVQKVYDEWAKWRNMNGIRGTTENP